MPVEFDEDIDVAVGGGVSPDTRTETPDLRDTVFLRRLIAPLPQNRLGLMQFRQHPNLFHIEQFKAMIRKKRHKVKEIPAFYPPATGNSFPWGESWGHPCIYVFPVGTKVRGRYGRAQKNNSF